MVLTCKHFSVGKGQVLVLIQRTAALCIRSLRAGRYKHYSPVTTLTNYSPTVPESQSPNVKIPGCPHAYSLITEMDILQKWKMKKKRSSRLRLWARLCPKCSTSEQAMKSALLPCKRKVWTSSENSSSSLHKQVHLQHVKRYNSLNLQGYLPFDPRGHRELKQGSAPGSYSELLRRTSSRSSYRLKVLMGVLLFNAYCDSKCIDRFRQNLAAPPKELRKDKQISAFINEKKYQRSLYIELDFIWILPCLEAMRWK